jgi:hypothetical protein
MNAGQKAAIKTIELAYEDCANFVETLSKGAIAGMPALSRTEGILAELIFQMVADAIRQKAATASCHFNLAFTQDGTA